MFDIHLSDENKKKFETLCLKQISILKKKQVSRKTVKKMMYTLTALKKFRQGNGRYDYETVKSFLGAIKRHETLFKNIKEVDVGEKDYAKLAEFMRELDTLKFRISEQIPTYREYLESAT